ncbi:pantoate--beta-alanine ligase [Cytobacillus sp. FJAT-54145]|uniref:Pantothenate synthetase n=1 Tax=Cytobacillus spartinae TaxID=3299023 RepID=A0ABW6KD95_9BACI
MKIITTVLEMQTEMREKKKSLKSIGFVPTMGFLHEGHIRLLRKARAETDIVVLSIFVNPLQFGPNEDLDKYPRDFDRDKEIALREEVDYLFFPSNTEMYPKSSSVKVVVQERTEVLCGKSRPGHFDGVATVLTKLFNIVLPDSVYMGMKDAQQVAVVDGLISDFHFPITLVPVDTVREEDGLAKSSRNVNLSPSERSEATVLFESLNMAGSLINRGERSPKVIVSEIEKLILSKSRGKIDYIEVLSYPELKQIEILEGKIIIALAVKFEHARLIDNIVLNTHELS